MPPITTPTPQWVLPSRHAPDIAARLAHELNAPLAVANALVHRGVDDRNKAMAFLEPALENLHDPCEMLDLDRAAVRIERAIRDGERILVQGDYDVDGVTSTFLLHQVLTELGAGVEYRIPHRIRDGYGLTIEAIDDARRRGCALVVTVDCGITAHEAVAHARTLGIDVVITDHHEPPERLPEAAAVVNPLRPGCPYPFKALAGVGVTFKLVERLLEGRGGLERAADFLDVVALGTIADVVPLVGENRVLARHGLDRLNASRRLGVRALIDVAGLAGRRITSGQVAFVLAPRINAAGRMGNAEQGMRLLLARDSGEARACAESLEEDNTRRRKYDESVLLDAGARVETELDFPACRSILLWSETWHPGVIGIVASRLVERYQRPTLLVAVDGTRGRGSGRSLPGLDLTLLLDGCRDLLVSHGGHAFAAGLTVERDQLPQLRERFEALVRAQQPELFVRRLEVDGALRSGECDLALVEWLERLAPHGLDNAEPVYEMLGARLAQVSVVGSGKHLRLTADDGSGAVEAIGFGMGDQAPALTRGGRVDLAFVPTRNEWQGETRVQLKLKGLRVP